jgi:hypothetical protein
VYGGETATGAAISSYEQFRLRDLGGSFDIETLAVVSGTAFTRTAAFRLGEQAGGFAGGASGAALQAEAGIFVTAAGNLLHQQPSPAPIVPINGTQVRVDVPALGTPLGLPLSYRAQLPLLAPFDSLSFTSWSCTFDPNGRFGTQFASVGPQLANLTVKDPAAGLLASNEKLSPATRQYSVSATAAGTAASTCTLRTPPTRPFSLVIACPPYVDVTGSVSYTWQAGVPVRETIALSGLPAGQGKPPYSLTALVWTGGRNNGRGPSGLNVTMPASSRGGTLLYLQASAILESGTWQLTFSFVDSAGCDGPYSTIYMTVQPSQCSTPLWPNSSPLPQATVGLWYQTYVAWLGDSSKWVAPITYTVSSGSIPPGLALEDNHLSGMPTSAGTFAFSLGAHSSNGCIAPDVDIHIMVVEDDGVGGNRSKPMRLIRVPLELAVDTKAGSVLSYPKLPESEHLPAFGFALLFTGTSFVHTPDY